MKALIALSAAALIAAAWVLAFSHGPRDALGSERAGRHRPAHRRVIRIPGDDPRIRVIGEPIGDEGSGSLPFIGVTCPQLMPVLEDGWTASFECFNEFARLCPPPITIREAENYTFRLELAGDLAAVDSFDTGLVLKVKVPASGLPLGMFVDFVIIPCAPRCAADRNGEDMSPRALPATVLFIDDVPFPAALFPTLADARPYERTAGVFFTDLCELIGPGSFDWWAMVEFSPASCPDLDGDGSPETGLTLARDNPAGTTVYCASPGAESFGADALDYFFFRVPHGLTRLNVFEPHGDFPPASPAAMGLGRVAGEDGTTRPWCFSLVAPGICLSGDPTGPGFDVIRVQDGTQIFDDTEIPVSDSDTTMDVLANMCAALEAKGYQVVTDPVNPLKKRLLRYPPDVAQAIGHECPRAADLACIDNVPGLNCEIGF